MGHRPRPRRRADGRADSLYRGGDEAYEKGLKKRLAVAYLYHSDRRLSGHDLFRQLVLKGAAHVDQDQMGHADRAGPDRRGLFLHYTLPQRDIVQIINTYNKITPIGANWMFYSIEDTGTGVETTHHPRHPLYRRGLSGWRKRDGLPQRGYRLVLAALFQVGQQHPAGRGDRT